MSFITITYPVWGSIREFGTGQAAEYENLFGQIQNFLGTTGWCDSNNLLDRGIGGANIAEPTIDAVNIADASLASRALADGSVGAAEIKDEEICEYHINRDITESSFIKVEDNWSPLKINRYYYVGTIPASIHSVNIDLSTLTPLEGVCTITNYIVLCQVQSQTVGPNAYYNYTFGYVNVHKTIDYYLPLSQSFVLKVNVIGT